jgi:hypothetical protein
VRYTVLWQPSAEQQLAAAWLEAGDRRAATRAAHAIDVRLGDGADDRGESRSAGRRILLVAPLGVLFRVEPEDCVARVLTVWSYGRRPRRG